MLTFQPLDARAPPPLLYVSLQGRGEPPILPSTVHTYVPPLSVLLLRQGVPPRHTSADPDTIPLIPALLTQ